VLHLIERRVGPTADDEMILAFLSQSELPFVVVATKIDKLNATERKNNLEAIRNHPSVGGAPVIPFSSLKGEGKEELWKLLLRAAFN
jgi:GTP-binding protein